MTTNINRVDLASERVGGRVLAANDEFFAGRENLVSQSEPEFIPDKYVATGKWMDGWETRRRREPGHDWCIIQLGLRGIPEQIVVDTSHFTGNYPERCLVEACDLPGRPTTAELDAAAWAEIVPESALRGDHRNAFDVAGAAPATHLRLRIFPDGGVARLRAYGRVAPAWDELDFAADRVDLGAVQNGGRIAGASDTFYSPALNLLLPGPARNMGDGWETKRRRDDGHDWVEVQLGARGRVDRVVVDTSHFKGNAPGRCSLAGRDGDGEWFTMLPESPLQPHQVHAFDNELESVGPCTHVRIDIFPDGGLARLRLFGRTERSRALIVGVGKLNAASDDDAKRSLLACCGSQAWVAGMAAGRPYADASEVMQTADALAGAMLRDAWLEAFAAHPKIGERGASDWSKDEQSGVDAAEQATLERLAQANRDYEERFGYIFIVCATGKSAPEMLALLEQRLGNDPADELLIAAEQQRKITRIRLEKLLTQ